jgi:hypothetical protein
MDVVVARIAAGRRTGGELIMEDVPATPMGEPGTFRLTASPGLAQGLAAEDVVRVAADGLFTVVRRGGNLAVQVFARELSDNALDGLVADVSGLGGRLDGGTDSADSLLRVFTIPVTAGFAAVETVFDAFVAAQPGAEWYFANVYDPADGVTPLNWWQH